MALPKSILDLRNQRTNQPDQFQQFLLNPQSFGATPKQSNIPTFEEWLASGGAMRDPDELAAGGERILGQATGQFSNASPEQQYQYQFYNMPRPGGDFLSKWGPALVGLGVGGLAAGAGFGAAGAPAVGGNAVNFAALNPAITGTMTDAPLLAAESVAPSIAEAAPIAGSTGPGVTSAGMQWLTQPAIDSAMATTPLGRLFGLSQPTSDLLSVLGTAGATGLGMFGSKRKSDDLADLRGELRADRAPFLNASTEWLRNPAAYFAGPGRASMDATIRAVTAKHGNPANNPTAQALIAEIGLRDWRNAVLGFGGLGTGGEQAQAVLGSRQADASGDVLTTLGGGIADLLHPKPQYKLSIGGITL